MNAVLDFPLIETQDATKVSPAEPDKRSLSDVALAVLAPLEPDLKALGLRYVNVAFDLKTPKGLEAARAARHDLRENGRFLVQRTRDKLKKDMNTAKSAVEAKAEDLIKLTQPEEDRLHTDIEARESEIEAERAERARIEREAAEAHAARLATIAGYVERCRAPDMTAERISNGMLILTETDVADEDKARAVELADAQCRALETMRTLQAQAAAREAEAARQEAIRAENERVAAENAREAARIAEEAAAIRREAAALEAARAAEVVRENQRKAAEEARIEAMNREELRLQEIEREDARLIALRQQEQASMTYPSGAPMFGQHIKENGDRVMLDEQGKRSIFCDVDEGDPIRPDDPNAAPPMTAEEMGAEKPEQMDDAALTPALRPDGTPKPVIRIELDDTPPAPLPPQPEPATVRLGQLQTDIPPLTEAFIKQLGFEATKDGRATLYTETQRAAILRAYVAYIQERI